jgi:hypothetical protein
MSPGNAAGQANPADSGPAASPTPPAHTRFLLPRSVQAKFDAVPPEHWAYGNVYASTLIGSEGADEANVAAWMSVLGWTADGVVLALEERARGLSWSKPDDAAMRRHVAADYLAFGSYLVAEIEPAEGLGRARSAFRNPDMAPTGAPRIRRDDLDDYLDRVQKRFHALPASRTSQTDQHLLMTCCGVARDAGTVTPALPVRRVAEAMKANPETVVAGIRRLQASGFLLPYGCRPVGGGQLYVIRAPWCHEPNTSDTDHCLKADYKCTDGDTLPRAHPAFHQRAVGRTGFDLLRALANRPATDREWYESAGVKRRTFYRHKASLTGAVEGLPALAMQTDGVWSLVPAIGEALDAHATYHGTDVSAAKQRATHEAARDSYAAFLLREVNQSFAPAGPTRAANRATGLIRELSELVSHSGRAKAFKADGATTSGVTTLSPLPQEVTCPAA